MPCATSDVRLRVACLSAPRRGSGARKVLGAHMSPRAARPGREDAQVATYRAAGRSARAARPGRPAGFPCPAAAAAPSGGPAPAGPRAPRCRLPGIGAAPRWFPRRPGPSPWRHLKAGGQFTAVNGRYTYLSLCANLEPRVYLDEVSATQGPPAEAVRAGRGAGNEHAGAGGRPGLL